MQTTLSFFRKLPLLFTLLLCCGSAGAQESALPIDSALKTKRFVFDVETVLPTSARARQVAGERYSLRVSGDSLVSNLPYFGRAFSAPINGDAGYNFTSASYGYTIKTRKKGGWNIELQPKDVTDLRKFILTVFDNGSATLQAQSNSRQAISYNGTVRAF